MAEEPMAEDPMAEDPMADHALAALSSWARMAVVSWARFASVHQLLRALNVVATFLDLNAMEPALETLLLEVVEA